MQRIKEEKAAIIGGEVNNLESNRLRALKDLNDKLDRAKDKTVRSGLRHPFVVHVILICTRITCTNCSKYSQQRCQAFFEAKHSASLEVIQELKPGVVRPFCVVFHVPVDLKPFCCQYQIFKQLGCDRTVTAEKEDLVRGAHHRARPISHGGRGGGTANTDAPQVNEGVTGGLKAPRSSVVCGLCSREACVRALSSPFRTLTHLSVCPQRGT